MRIDDLRLSPATRNLLRRGGIEDLSDLGRMRWLDGSVAMPSGILRSKLEQVIRTRTDGVIDGTGRIGPTRWQELFDAVLLYAAALPGKAAPVNAQAFELVKTMLASTSGEIGGLDQTRNFASIAFDFVEALRLEEAKRSAP